MKFHHIAALALVALGVAGWAGWRQAGLSEAVQAVGADPGDTLVCRKRRELPVRRLEMRALPCAAHDHLYTSRVGTSMMSQASA